MYNIDTCAICRETIETSETRVLPCNHSYHKECIDSWLVRVPSCPYCRTKVVIEGVTPRPFVRRVTPRPLPDDDIVPWLHVSGRDVTREEMVRFICVVRHNSNFDRTDVNRVIHHFFVYHNFNIHLLLLPDDEFLPWYFASRYGGIPEPVMDRFVRELRHNFDHRQVHEVLNNALIRQSVYSADLQQLIEQAYQETTR
jgi:predicted nucleic-acid-binding protein